MQRVQQRPCAWGLCLGTILCEGAMCWNGLLCIAGRNSPCGPVATGTSIALRHAFSILSHTLLCIAEVALPPQEDLLRWDSDNKIEAEPMSDGNLASQPNTQAQQSLSAPYMQSQQGYQQHSTGGWSAPGGVPVGYPTPGAAPNFQARPNSAVRMQSQAWGNSNTAGLKALQLAPDQSAALQEYVGFSLMDDHMDMAAVNSALPPAMDISPLTPRPPPTSTAATPTPHNALVLYQSPPAQPLTSSASNGWYQPGILPSMQRFDGPQHQLSFEHSTDFSQPGNAGMSNGGMQARAAFGGEQQTQGGANPLQSAGISSTRPFSAGFRPGPRQQHQQQQQQPFTPPEVRGFLVCQTC